MSRRAALILAGATVLALLAAMVAVTFRLEALRTQVPAPKAEPTRTKPIVREVTRTITVHRTKKEKPEGAGPVITVVRTMAPSTTSPSATSSAPKPEGEHEGGGEKHEDDVAGDKFK
jgi:hypothetical protein